MHRHPAGALQALKAFQKLGKAQPEDPDIPKHLARLHHRLGGAEAAIEVGAVLLPSTPVLLTALLMCLCMSSDMHKSLPAMRRAAKLRNLNKTPACRCIHTQHVMNPHLRPAQRQPAGAVDPPILENQIVISESFGSTSSACRRQMP